MAQYEYKVLHGKPLGTSLLPWARQEMTDKIGPGSFERRINDLASQGWEVFSFSAIPVGNFFWFSDFAVVLLRRAKEEDNLVGNG